MTVIIIALVAAAAFVPVLLVCDRRQARCRETVRENEELIRKMDCELRTIREELRELRELLPKDGAGEVARNATLLRQINDEMEEGLRLERQWNEGVQSILGYGKPRSGEG